MTKPLISVCLITYNHKDYINNAIESILKQKGLKEESWEIIIADDCSTDNTQTIISDYKKKYPKRINTILHKMNIGADKNFIGLLAKAKGKYIAYLEGDDFWTDENKLKIQFEFLEKNRHLVGCFGNSNVIDKNNRVIEKFFLKTKIPNEISQKDLWNSNYIGQTGTLMFAKSALEKIHPIFYKYPWDRILQFGLADHGNWGYIDKIFSSYRIHSAGTYSMIGSKKQLENLNEINKTIYSVKNWRKKYNHILRKKLSYLNLELYKQNVKEKNNLKKIKSMFAVLYYCESKTQAIKALLKNF